MDLDANPTPASVDPAEESSGEGPTPKEGDAAAAKFVGLLVAISFVFFRSSNLDPTPSRYFLVAIGRNIIVGWLLPNFLWVFIYI